MFYRFCYIRSPAEICGSGSWSAEYFGSAEGLRTFVDEKLPRYIVGTLTNKANIVLLSPLSLFHWLQNTWPWMTLNSHFALNSVLCFSSPILTSIFGVLKPGFRSLATLKHVCCRRTLNRKEQLRHREVSLRQHGFLVDSDHPVEKSFRRHCIQLNKGIQVYFPSHWGSRKKISKTIECSKHKTSQKRNLTQNSIVWKWHASQYERQYYFEFLHFAVFSDLRHTPQYFSCDPSLQLPVPRGAKHGCLSAYLHRSISQSINQFHLATDNK